MQEVRTPSSIQGCSAWFCVHLASSSLRGPIILCCPGYQKAETAQMSLAQDKSLAICQPDTAHRKKDRIEGEPSAWTILGYYMALLHYVG